MLLERIVSAGLAHYSYLVGDKNQALVIDPRRDVDDYIKMATGAGMRIAYVLETHRNEDYFVGSMELAGRTGARSGMPTVNGTTSMESQPLPARNGRWDAWRSRPLPRPATLREA